MRVASSTASQLFGLGNLHAMAVEVMGLGAHAEPQGEGEDDSAHYSDLQRSETFAIGVPAKKLRRTHASRLGSRHQTGKPHLEALDKAREAAQVHVERVARA